MPPKIKPLELYSLPAPAVIPLSEVGPAQLADYLMMDIPNTRIDERAYATHWSAGYRTVSMEGQIVIGYLGGWRFKDEMRAAQWGMEALRLIVDHPKPPYRYQFTVSDVINDLWLNHGWTREQIAAWLRTL